MTVRQLPGFAFRTAADYATEMGKLHDRYDAALGTVVVNWMERLQLFNVFTSVWFSVGLVILIVSIVACTIDRIPRLWRQVSDVRVVQPDAYFDPRLPDRARMDGLGAAEVGRVLRRHGFRIRETTVGEGDAAVRYVYGDRHQYTKLATILTHLGLILFLIAAAVTSRLGDEQGLVVGEGQTLPVQPIGTPGLLLVRNLDFEAPGFDAGRPTDFTTDLVVYQDGREIAHKVIRVNDPLTVAGYTFHQNGFGPAPDLLIKDKTGAVLWSGPAPMTETNGDLPYGTLPVPGRDVGLELLLVRDTNGVGTLITIPYRVIPATDGSDPTIQRAGTMYLQAGQTWTLDNIDFSVELRSFSDYTLLIAKKDPGQPIVWAAFASLIVGLLITFYLPRRRVWARLTGDGSVALVGRADRHVDFDREFGRLLEDLVAARLPAVSPAASASPPSGSAAAG